MKRIIKPVCIIAALLALAALIALAGCSKPGVPAASEAPEPTEQAAVSTPEPTEQTAVSTPEPTEQAEPTQAPKEDPVVFTNALFENAVRQELGVYGDTPLYPSRLAKVTKLELSHKMLSEINDIAWFTGLERLELSGNPDVTNIEYLSRLENLRYLDLCSTGVSDLSAIAELKDLRVLRIVGTPVKDLGPLAGLTSLLELDIDGYDFDPLDIAPLAGLVNLEKLEVSTDDLAPLAGLTELKSLTICGKYSDLNALTDLMKLEVLHIMGDSRPLDITGLSSLVNLRQLMIQIADVGSLEPLSGMKSLFLLSLNYVVTDGIGPLSELTGCTDMFLTNCGITDLTPLYTLTGLKELELSYNPLTYDQIAELRKHLPFCSISFVRSDG